jgi:hypothetical protein
MRTVKDIFVVLALLSVFAFFGTLTTISWLGYRSRAVVAQALTDRVDPVLDAVTKTVNGDPQSKALYGKLPLRDALMAQVSSALVKADKQLTSVQAVVTNVADKADKQLTAMNGTVTGLGSKLDPVLASYTKLGDASTALVGDAKDSLDDLYPDLNAFVQTANVTAVGIAVTSEAVGKAAPEMSKAFVGIGQSVDGIAKDVHAEADEFVKPKTLWQKLRMWVDLGGRVALRIL